MPAARRRFIARLVPAGQFAILAGPQRKTSKMPEEFTKYGSLKVRPGVTEIRVARTFPHSVERVWQALVEPELLAEWLAPGTIDPREGGRIRLEFADSGIVIDSDVAEFDAPHAVAYSWSNAGEPHRPLRFETKAEGDGTLLTLTLQLPSGEDAARMAAGFEAHLEMLAAALDGTPIAFPFATFMAMRAVYQVD
jgi:uncharacterized protein YndB with AHSA1/START domain